MICCKRPVTTKFCPHCGAQTDGPARTLLNYLNVQLDAQKTKLSNLRDNLPDDEWGKQRRDKMLAQAEGTVAKWESWIAVATNFTDPEPSGQSESASDEAPESSPHPAYPQQPPAH